MKEAESDSFSAMLLALRRDAGCGRGLVLLAVVTVLVAVLGVILAGRVPPLVPLHYSRPWGELQLVDRNRLWWLVGGSGVVGLVNVAAAAGLLKQQRLLARLVIWGSVLLMFLLAVVLATVWIRVGR